MGALAGLRVSAVRMGRAFRLIGIAGKSLLLIVFSRRRLDGRGSVAAWRRGGLWKRSSRSGWFATYYRSVELSTREQNRMGRRFCVRTQA